MKTDVKMRRAAAFAALGFAFCAGGRCAQSRVVSLLPSNTRTLYALGAEPVCVSNFCAAGSAVPRCGDSFSPDIEKIVSLHPDVVLAGGTRTSGARARLARLGIKTVEIPDPQTVAGVFDGIVLIGEAAGKRAEALKLAGRMRAELAALELRARNTRPPRVYVELDVNHWTAGAGSYITDLVAAAGGENIFADLKSSYGKVAWESIVERSPDVILDLSFVRTDFEKLAGAGLVPAIKNRRVLRPGNADEYLRPSVNIVGTLAEFNSLLFPAHEKTP
ncbi:MAG: helical backbone metal receptor [Elusimicrobiaceae bacterium]|nr:helical backbone metal receptor [Elusimicrobiaceae bacterium]